MIRQYDTIPKKLKQTYAPNKTLETSYSLPDPIYEPGTLFSSPKKCRVLEGPMHTATLISLYFAHIHHFCGRTPPRLRVEQ
ncbi:hypothetical protein ACHAXS_000298, partial [Conticribra weissflogii]